MEAANDDDEDDEFRWSWAGPLPLRFGIAMEDDMLSLLLLLL